MSYVQAEKDFRNLCKKNKFSRHEICGKSRVGRLVEQRKIIANELHKLNYSSCMIGHVMDKDHSTILYYIKKGKNDAV